jgi:hypothetical protein
MLASGGWLGVLEVEVAGLRLRNELRHSLPNFPDSRTRLIPA